MSKLRRTLLAVVFLVTGLGLIVCILAGVSLSWVLALLFPFALIGGGIVYFGLGSAEKKVLKHRLVSGLAGGFLATLAYDLSRTLFYHLFPFHVWPFEAIPLFGQLLMGDSFSKSWTLGVGILYHATNGVAFGAAYSILFAPKGWIVGIGWALFLEALMLAIYPGWLGIKFFEEFATISVIGHLAYGFVLGMFCRWDFLRRSRQ